MAMATQGLADQVHFHHRSEPNSSHPGAFAASSIATNRWGPYSGAGDFASNMAVILAVLLAALALGLALSAAVRYLLRLDRNGDGSGTTGGEDGNSTGSSLLEGDPEKALVELQAPTPPQLPALVYSAAAAAAAATKLAGAAAECAICLVEFADGDAVRVMPACRHGFHARCIDRWLAMGRRSSCPTCRAPAVVVVVAAGSAAAAAAGAADGAQPGADESATRTPASAAAA